MDPNDIVVRNNNITSRLETTNDNIKREEEDLALYMEFFAKPNNQTKSGRENIEKSCRDDIVSLRCATDETDTMSSLSTNSLGEFLQTCQRLQSQSNKNNTASKVTSDDVQATIKSEALENVITNRKGLSISSNDSALVKQEPQRDGAIQNTLTAESNNFPKKVPRSREGVSPNHNNAIDNDDIVPPTALFFRSDYQNALPTFSNNACEYDEFYGTGINDSSQTTTDPINIKIEHLDTPRSKTTNKNGKPLHQPEILNPKSNNNTLPSKQQCNINFTAISKATDDDDLVPAQNLLGSCRPLWNAIKQELEHEDIFSVPFKKTNQLNDDENQGDICSNDSTENLLTPSKSTENDDEVLNSNVPEEDDDGKFFFVFFLHICMYIYLVAKKIIIVNPKFNFIRIWQNLFIKF